MVLIHLFVRQGPIIRLVSNSVRNPFLPLRDGSSSIKIEERDLFDEGLLESPDRFHHVFPPPRLHRPPEKGLGKPPGILGNGLKPLSLLCPLYHLLEIDFKEISPFLNFIMAQDLGMNLSKTPKTSLSKNDPCRLSRMEIRNILGL